MAKNKENFASFNTALGQVIRLNGILDMAADYAMSLNAYKWYHCLWQVYTEIYPYMSSEERTDFKNRLLTANQSLANENNSSRRFTSVMSDPLYVEFRLLDCELRIIADKHGLLIPEKKTFMDMLAVEEF